jgi:hypothetical protein
MMYSFRLHPQQRIILFKHDHFPAVAPLGASIRVQKNGETLILVNLHKSKKTFVPLDAIPKMTLVHYRLWTLFLL